MAARIADLDGTEEDEMTSAQGVNLGSLFNGRTCCSSTAFLQLICLSLVPGYPKVDISRLR
jgi:hypothetical protein